MAKELRPFVDSGPVSEFGETDASYTAEDRMTTLQEDFQYVPGFSDLRYQRELELAEYHQGRRMGRDVSSLPANCYWARRNTPNGKTDSAALMRKKLDQYRPVLKDEAGKVPWLTELVDGWSYTPEGHIISASGELQLMVLEGAAAANRARKKEKKWIEQSGGVQKDPATASHGGKWGAEKEMKGQDGQSVADHVTTQKPEGKGRVAR